MNFPFLDGNVPRSTSYGVYISQLIRFARVPSHVDDFNTRNNVLTAKLLRQGYRYHKINKEFSKFYWRYFDYSILFYPITLEGRLGTTDEFATIPFHLDLFSAALVELAKSIPVNSLILSSHLFFCLPLFLFPFTVPCRIVFAKPEDLETWPNHLSFRFLTRVRSLSYSPMAAWIFLQTSSLVTWSLYEMSNSLRYHLISKACVLFSNSAVKVHDSQAYRNMETTTDPVLGYFWFSSSWCV